MFLTHVLSTAVVNAAPESRITLLTGEDFAKFLNLTLVHRFIRLAFVCYFHRLNIATLGLCLDHIDAVAVEIYRALVNFAVLVVVDLEHWNGRERFLVVIFVHRCARRVTSSSVRIEDARVMRLVRGQNGRILFRFLYLSSFFRI